MRNKIVLTAAVAVLSAGLAASAQSAGSQSQPGSTTPQTAQTQADRDQSGTTTTLTGCVYREKDVPGRTPNVAEQAGVMEDYILAEVEASASQPGQAGSVPGATGTSGSHDKKMFKLEQIADERLRAVVGKRVEVTGRIDADDTASAATGTSGSAPAKPDTNIGSPDDIELPEFEVTSIREVSGDCPPSPSVPKK